MQLVVNNILVNYLVFKNSDSGDYIVILPGWKNSADSWKYIGSELAKKHNVVILDFPGFGKTPKPKSAFDTFDYADFVKAFLKKLEIEKCTLLGHSFGGRVGTILAAKSDFVERLILVASAGIEKETLLIKLKTSFVKAIKPLKKIMPEEIVKKISYSLGSQDYKDAGEMRDIFIKTVNQDLEHLLPKIKVPTLVIWGDRDGQLNVSLTKVYKNKIKDCIVRVVWGTGHHPHAENPQKFLDIINNWL
jgi:pimeloyl-ACP methyl ester carboxylesterase